MWVKSVIYLIGFTGFGWVLMKITEPNAAKRRAIEDSVSTQHLSDDVRRKHLIVAKLKEAARIKDE